MPFNDEHRHKPKGYANSREFAVGAVVILIGVLLAFSIALNFVG